MEAVLHALPLRCCALQIAKLLIHRLFPNAKYSLWVDGKLRLRRDPYIVFERYSVPRDSSEALVDVVHVAWPTLLVLASQVLLCQHQK